MTLDLAPELGRIFADPTQLEAALLDLVVNRTPDRPETAACLNPALGSA